MQNSKIFKFIVSILISIYYLNIEAKAFTSSTDSLISEEEYIQQKVNQIVAQIKANEAVLDPTKKSFVVMDAAAYTGPSVLFADGAIRFTSVYSQIKSDFGEYHFNTEGERRTHESNDVNITAFLNNELILINTKLEEAFPPPAIKPLIFVGFDSFLWEIVTKNEIKDNTDWLLTDDKIFKKKDYAKAFFNYNAINEKILALAQSYITTHRLIFISYGSFNEIQNKIEGSNLVPSGKKWYWANYTDSANDANLRKAIYNDYNTATLGFTFSGVKSYVSRVSDALLGNIRPPNSPALCNANLTSIFSGWVLVETFKYYDAACFKNMTNVERVHCLKVLAEANILNQWFGGFLNSIYVNAILRNIPEDQVPDFLVLFKAVPNLFKNLVSPTQGLNGSDFTEFIDLMNNYVRASYVAPDATNDALTKAAYINPLKSFPFINDDNFISKYRLNELSDNSIIISGTSTTILDANGNPRTVTKQFPPTGSFQLYDYVLVTFLDDFGACGDLHIPAGKQVWLPAVTLYGYINAYQNQGIGNSIRAAGLVIVVAAIPFSGGSSLYLLYADAAVGTTDLYLHTAAFNKLHSTPAGRETLRSWDTYAAIYGVARIAGAGTNYLSGGKIGQAADDLILKLKQSKSNPTITLTPSEEAEVNRLLSKLKGSNTLLSRFEELGLTSLKTEFNLFDETTKTKFLNEFAGASDNALILMNGNNSLVNYWKANGSFIKSKTYPNVRHKAWDDTKNAIITKADLTETKILNAIENAPPPTNNQVAIAGAYSPELGGNVVLKYNDKNFNVSLLESELKQHLDYLTMIKNDFDKGGNLYQKLYSNVPLEKIQNAGLAGTHAEVLATNEVIKLLKNAPGGSKFNGIQDLNKIHVLVKGRSTLGNMCRCPHCFQIIDGVKMIGNQ
jgi:hypothetical protein